ncbi:MAG: cell division protein ZapA [Rickettsiales bacterium]|nr:cell division protein ZapA [Rickettsiales bacterium]
MIELPIGKSNYQISCKQSEQEKLSHLAEKLNKRLNRLGSKIQDADEQTLLAVTALMLEGELEQAENSDEVAKLNDEDMQEAVSETMENIADYVEKLTKKIESY